MKKYIATFWRGNPQLKDGGYETTREIEAVSITSARKKARDIEDGCVAAAETPERASREPTANKKWEEIQP